MELSPKTSDAKAEDEVIEDEEQDELRPDRLPAAPEETRAEAPEPVSDEMPDELSVEDPEDVPLDEIVPLEAAEADSDEDSSEDAPDTDEPEVAVAEPSEVPSEEAAVEVDAADDGEDDSDPEDPKNAPRLGPGEDLSDEEIAREAAALLFATTEPLRVPRLVELLGRPHPQRVRAALEGLAEQLPASGLPVVLRSIAGRWRLLTDPEMEEVVGRLDKERKPEKLSGAALETLAIVAYRQPVTKAEIEAIRGVQSGPMLRSLVDRTLLRVTGRADVPGSPLLYGTTRDFLERFGLDSLKDLPRDGELTES